MANATFSNTIVLDLADVTAGELTFDTASEFGSGGLVSDSDPTGVVSSGDTYPYPDPGNAYSGYTVNIDGKDYALFHYAHGDYLFVPHNGELEPDDFTSGMTVVAQETATVANCFGAGTMIATATGEVAVEDLRPGDTVRTEDGRDVEVLWIGRQTFRPVTGLDPVGDMVDIAADAFGPGLPHSDLSVTADHALALDGVLVHAGALEGGRGIRVRPAASRRETEVVYHVETARHEVLVANGLGSESFVDASSRPAYDNYAEYMETFGAERIVPEMDMLRVSSARLLPPSVCDTLGLDSGLQLGLLPLAV